MNIRSTPAPRAAAERAWVVEGRTKGPISEGPRGESGFGWDAIFIPEGQDRTWGESTAAEKDAISHRRRAWERLAAELARDSR
jgi:XTP/dITP diphosphohydrolase